MTKTKTFIILLICLSVIITPSCDRADPDEENGQLYSSGILIANEGAFGNLNGSISFLDRDSSIVQNNLFYKVNGRPLGDVVQSVTVFGDRAYIVVNNSQKVEVVDLKTFQSAGVIEGLSYPRYFLGIDEGKGYVSNGAMEGKVYIIDLQSLTRIDSIEVGFGPEQMLLVDNRVYVANSGGWLNDNTISVIDPGSDELVQSIVVGDNPVAMCPDGNEGLWVLCKGQVSWNEDYTIAGETESELLRLNLSSMEILTRVQTGAKGDYFWPTRLGTSPEGDKILFIESGGIYVMDSEGSDLPIDPLVPGIFYGFGVDPESGNIYGLTAGDFSSSGFLYRYHADGALIDSMMVGIAPNQVVFY